MKKKLVLMMSALMAIGLLSACNQHHHSFKEVKEVAATCTETGTKAHYTCEECDKIFDADKNETTLEALTIAALGHNLTAHASHAETCTEAGNSAYWSCERCGKFYSDAEGKKEIKNNGWIIPAHHTLTHHEGKDATRLEEGNIEYWTCDVCDKYFSDEEGQNEISAESIILPALGTDKSYFDGKTSWKDKDEYYFLYLTTYGFNDLKIGCSYDFDDFDYDKETKELSFIVTELYDDYAREPSPYKVGDKISFIYNEEKDVLMFGTIELIKRQ